MSYKISGLIAAYLLSSINIANAIAGYNNGTASQTIRASATLVNTSQNNLKQNDTSITNNPDEDNFKKKYAGLEESIDFINNVFSANGRNSQIFVSNVTDGFTNLHYLVPVDFKEGFEYGHINVIFEDNSIMFTYAPAGIGKTKLEFILGNDKLVYEVEEKLICNDYSPSVNLPNDLVSSVLSENNIAKCGADGKNTQLTIESYFTKN